LLPSTQGHIGHGIPDRLPRWRPRRGRAPWRQSHDGALIVAYFAFRGDASQHWRLFLTTGVLGGYTTFSAFSLDVALFYERGELALALLYVGSSVVLAIAGLFIGLAIVRQLT
jgi:fluoride ion exporter CrcB/FEX